MPIYEFACPKCRVVFNFLSRRIDPANLPACPKCGNKKMVKQMSGEYSCRSPRLYSLNWICRKLARSLTFSISHVPREDNAEANGLAQAALRRRGAVTAKF